jgi:hypothetical protein
LETDDGRFRLGIRAVERFIELTLETLRFATEESASRRLGLARRGPWYSREQPVMVTLPRREVVAIIALNADGNGQCQVEDSPEVRQALLDPVIRVIEDD